MSSGTCHETFAPVFGQSRTKSTTSNGTETDSKTLVAGSQRGMLNRLDRCQALGIDCVKALIRGCHNSIELRGCSTKKAPPIDWITYKRRHVLQVEMPHAALPRKNTPAVRSARNITVQSLNTAHSLPAPKGRQCCLKGHTVAAGWCPC